MILAYTRADVAELNRLARERLRAAGELGEEHREATERGERAFAAGDRLMFLKNERGLGVKNGTLGTVEGIEAGGGRLAVRLDGAGADGSAWPVRFELRDYAHVDHGYAVTIHKAQGVTVDRAHVLASGFIDRHAAYVALTRHREGMSLHYGRGEFSDGQRLARALGRERLKDTSLDYTGPEGVEHAAAAYAARRGLDPLRPESEIVVRRPPEPEASAAAERAREAARQQAIAAGRARFREGYAAHQRRKTAMERDEQARALVGNWDGLIRGYNAALPGVEADGALGGARAQLL